MTWSKNFEFSYHFLGKIKSFPILNIVNIPKLGFSRKKTENHGESLAEREKHPFLCQKSETLIFLNLVRGSEIMKV